MTLNQLTLVFCLFYFSLQSQNLKAIDSLMKLHEDNGFSGNVLYANKDSIVFKGSYGYANFEKEIKLNDDAKFDLASLSKQFTAVSILMLIEQNKLQYTTDIKTIWPNLPYNGITIEHLLRHQSGLPDYMDFLEKKSYWDQSKIATNQDIINLLTTNNFPLLFKSGTENRYSNTGYVVLASIVEKLSETTFEEFLQKNIFTPLDMNNSKIVRRIYKPDNDSSLTVGYFKKGNKNKPNYLFNDELKIYDGIVGDGMIHTTTTDLYKWIKALKNNTLISKSNTEKMFSGDAISSSTGFGLMIQESKSLGKYVLHTGNWQGYINFMLYVLKSEEFVVILSNNSYEEYSLINNQLIKNGRQSTN